MVDKLTPPYFSDHGYSQDVSAELSFNVCSSINIDFIHHVDGQNLPFGRS